jgi:dienelactone hydrolase
MSDPEFQMISIDNIPVAVCLPAGEPRGKLAVWLPYLGGDRHTVLHELKMLANAGYVAISLDPWLHGERKDNSKASLRTRVLKDFRAVMWPILGYTTLDTFRIIDWAIREYSLAGDVVAGGVSAGGDIALALAGIDKRIVRVAAIASTPDWLRPGMTDVMDQSKMIDQGEATPQAQWFYDQLNPATHTPRYLNRPLAMHFELGGADTHIPAKHMMDFRDKIQAASPHQAASINIRLVEAAKHISLIQKRAALNACIEFLARDTDA